MTADHSTYTYEDGAQETVTLSRGPATPTGHAVLKIEYSDGEIADCYVNTAWLRDRLNDLGEPRRLTPDAITDEMERRAIRKGIEFGWFLEGDANVRDVREKTRAILTAALTEPTRPTELQVLAKVSAYMDEAGGKGIDAVTDFLAERGVRVVTEGEN